MPNADAVSALMGVNAAFHRAHRESPTWCGYRPKPITDSFGSRAAYQASMTSTNAARATSGTLP